ncbi:hypothetical protein KSS93_10465 [Pseudomonas xanthosomatis]|uniref:hypothetical protein n=1 Tax=Pseudomonas xanthosomatis TaxID=2842356 RepID=UPI001C3D6987|nr:hypothetical protein [Pseudomonas xanthosomatis]QXH48308.1 hypothetical protein KSS93_10465 [Pseudomonas xanthosomatis]
MSDSLALARQTPESLQLEDAWPMLLREQVADAEWLQFSMGGATSSDLLAQSEYWLHARQDVSWLIVQAGIVDCAPRAFSRNELVQQKALALFTRVFPRSGRRLFEWLRRRRNVSYIGPERFRQNVQAFRELANRRGIRLLWLPVLGAEFYEGILPGVTEKIAQTNEILQQELGGALVDTRLPEAWYMADGHHLRLEAHRHLAHVILKHINEERY